MPDQFYQAGFLKRCETELLAAQFGQSHSPRDLCHQFGVNADHSLHTVLFVVGGENKMNTTVNVDTPGSAAVPAVSPASVARHDQRLRLQLQAFLQFHPAGRRMPTRAPSAPLRPPMIRGFKPDYAHREILFLQKGIEKRWPAAESAFSAA